jgi:hypothetical protein
MMNSMSGLQQHLQRLQGAVPADFDQLVVATPAHAFFESVLGNPDSRRRRAIGPFLGGAGHLERHRPDGAAVGRQPVGIGDEEAPSFVDVHDRAAKHAAKPSHQLVAEFVRCPLDGKGSEQARRRDRAGDLPPHGERLVVEKGAEHRAGGSVDDD